MSGILVRETSAIVPRSIFFNSSYADEVFCRGSARLPLRASGCPGATSRHETNLFPNALRAALFVLCLVALRCFVLRCPAAQPGRLTGAFRADRTPLSRGFAKRAAVLLLHRTKRKNMNTTETLISPECTPIIGQPQNTLVKPIKFAESTAGMEKSFP